MPLTWGQPPEAPCVVPVRERPSWASLGAPPLSASPPYRCRYVARAKLEAPREWVDEEHAWRALLARREDIAATVRTTCVVVPVDAQTG
jgi:hypothetical protein